MSLRDDLITLVHEIAASTPLPEVPALLKAWEMDYVNRRRTASRGFDKGAERFWYVAVTHPDGSALVVSGSQLKGLLYQAEKRLGRQLATMTLGAIPDLRGSSPTIDVHTPQTTAEQIMAVAPGNVVRVTEDDVFIGILVVTHRLESLPGRMYSANDSLFGGLGKTAPTRNCVTRQHTFDYLEIDINDAGDPIYVCPVCKTPYPDDEP